MVGLSSVWPLQSEVDPNAFALIPNLELYTLTNGLRVLLMLDDRDRGTYLSLNVNAGSIHQSASKRGIAHFTEHMLFQGTKLFPDQKAFLEHAEEFNLSWNGYTAENEQNFFVESDNDAESVREAFIHLSQLAWEPLLPEAKIEKEREVVFSERQAAMSEPDNITREVTLNHFFDATSPYAGGGILGTENDIRSFSHQDVVDFHSRYFNPANMLLLVVGGAKVELYRSLIQEYFDKSSKSAEAAAWVSNPLLGTSRRGQPHTTLEAHDFNHVSLKMGYYFNIPTEIMFPSAEWYALQFAAEAISTRVFLDLRDSKGLAYSVGCGFRDFDLGAFWGISGEFPKEKYQKSYQEVEDYIRTRVFEPITPAEFKRVMRAFMSTRWANSARKIGKYVQNNLFTLGQVVAPESFQRYFKDLDLEFVNLTVNSKLQGRQIDVVSVGAIA